MCINKRIKSHRNLTQRDSFRSLVTPRDQEMSQIQIVSFYSLWFFFYEISLIDVITNSICSIFILQSSKIKRKKHKNQLKSKWLLVHQMESKEIEVKILYSSLFSHANTNASRTTLLLYSLSSSYHYCTSSKRNPFVRVPYLGEFRSIFCVISPFKWKTVSRFPAFLLALFIWFLIICIHYRHIKTQHITQPYLTLL